MRPEPSFLWSRYLCAEVSYFTQKIFTIALSEQPDSVQLVIGYTLKCVKTISIIDSDFIIRTYSIYIR